MPIESRYWPRTLEQGWVPECAGRRFMGMVSIWPRVIRVPIVRIHWGLWGVTGALCKVVPEILGFMSQFLAECPEGRDSMCIGFDNRLSRSSTLVDLQDV